MLLQSVHCHIVNILICVKKMSMLITGNERMSGYVLVHVGLSQPCHILIWATLYGKK